MRKFHIFIAALAFCSTAVLSGCESLDQAPEDYFASGNFWEDEAQVDGYMVGMHSYLRSSWGTNFSMGELRGGLLGDGDDGTGTSVMGESLNAQTIIKQDLREDNAYFNNWNGLYYEIVSLNLAINEIGNCSFLSDADKAYYLAQAYGMRAYYYFLLYRTWGGVPLVTDVAITDGEVSAERLSRARASASEIMQLMKDDINKSESYFNSASTIWEDQYTWSKYATLMLKANIYTWAAKVTTGDQTATGTADLDTARIALNEIISSNKFSLMSDFASVFRSGYESSNTEMILAVPYNRTDEVSMPNASSCLAQVNLFTAAYDLDGNALSVDNTDTYGTNTLVGGILRYQYKESFWDSFDSTDTRRDATFFALRNNITSEATGGNFGVLLHKFAGTYYASEGVHYLDADGPIFRYAETLLLMAEVENDLGNDPSTYINMIRQRAYGDDYPVYSNSSTYENTKAILTECDKEFVFEGKRWFNLIRMQDADGQSLVFDSSVNYPFIPGADEGAVLSTSESYKVLWPVSVATMTNDPLVTQTEGYD